ncbi:hypothetical protein BU26DRAFT_523797 [Trematosphaeria pertusa]|uniref:SCP domain-containing protein n=1 Tax=Trematosphaeria pertusa TaxID=390896 RepID=A0A6A6HZQ1_9PLEO|nr:uncharacterized protein BU26DRAFT_523797 [Trematosphaeria pertusa]KAF2243507.1 hypothetical protein BU26DRAFT_523797 [Trematosphaeria pertusa]
MHAIATLSLLALAGSALAAPAPRQHRGPKIVYETKLVTVIVTPGQPHPTPAPEPQPEPSSQVVVPTTTVVKVETPSAPAAPPSSAVVESSAAPVATAPASTGYMAIVDEWRAKLGLSKLTEDSQLAANAERTCAEGNGQMVHQLFSGSMAQVLAPGGPEDFEHVFVGGWLCERPDMAGMDGICATASEGWAYAGQTGHADILTSPSYSKIGCGNAGGIWGCDLA